MEIKLIVMIVLFILQVGCLGYSIFKKVGIFDVWYGYAIWGTVPINLINLLF